MMRGTSAVRIMSKPSSPIVHTMSDSPSLGEGRAEAVELEPRARPPRGRAETTAAAAPSAKTEAATICCGSSDERMCSVHSSAAATSTTASGWAAQIRAAARSPGSAAAQPMKPMW